VLSFDDGYRSQYTDALPVLKRRRWPGVLNLTTGTLSGYPRLHRVHVRRMIAAGWQLDAHTVTID
jgi:peptidoglycan/xylan/chitin deacetylase (PgdA/CDA1 family)